MNIELAREVIEDAKAHQDRFHMSVWMAKPTGEDFGYGPVFEENFEMTKEEGQTVPPCGTVGCFAGFAALRVAKPGAIITNGEVRHKNGHVSEVGTYAAKALGLSEEQASIVFYLDNLKEVEVAVDYLTEHPRADADALADAGSAARSNA